MIVERVRFEQVYYVESVCSTSSRVGYPKVVPLCEAASVIVRFKNQVILEFVDLNGSAQISRLKARFKNKSMVIFEAWLIVWSQNLVIITVTWMTILVIWA